MSRNLNTMLETLNVLEKKLYYEILRMQLF